MPTEDMTSDDVATLIRTAFRDVPRPTGLELAPHQCPECDDVRRLLEPYTFDTVPDAVLDQLWDSLPFLGPRGLLHYLPAYLLRTIKSLDYQGLEHLVFHLAPSERDLDDRAEYWRERLAVFSPQQRTAIRAFVAWFASTPAAAEYSREMEGARRIWEEAA